VSNDKLDIHPSAKIADDVEIGPWTSIGANTVIGSGTRIGSHVMIGENTELGCNNNIYSHVCIGADPQHVGYKGEKTSLVVGDNNVIREFTTISRGTVEGRGVTSVGSHNYLMAYVHIAHDCEVGHHVVFCNLAQIAGHVCVGDYVFLASYAGVHQHCQIGAYSCLGRATKIYQDILPFMMVTGNPGVPTGLNSVGLRRHGFNGDVLRALKQAYSILYRRDMKLSQIRLELEVLAKKVPEVNMLLDRINSSTRGIARSRRVNGSEEVVR